MALIEQANEALETIRAVSREIDRLPQLPGGGVAPGGAVPSPAAPGREMTEIREELFRIRTALESSPGGLSTLRGPGGIGQ